MNRVSVVVPVYNTKVYISNLVNENPNPPAMLGRME